MQGMSGVGRGGGGGGEKDAAAARKRTRRPRPYNTRDLVEGGAASSSERRRQVSAVLDRPEERRNPMRFLPDYQGRSIGGRLVG